MPSKFMTFANPRHDADMQVDCSLRDAAARQRCTQILRDPGLNAYHSFDNRDRVTIGPQPVTVETGRIGIALPAMSIAALTVDIA